MYNVCSVYRKEVQWLLRLELSGEVLFPEIEVVPKHNNQERNNYKKKIILKIPSWMFFRSKKEMKMKEGD